MLTDFDIVSDDPKYTFSDIAKIGARVSAYSTSKLYIIALRDQLEKQMIASRVEL